MSTINWNEVVNEVGVESLRDFCTGNMTRREFEAGGGLPRQIVRELGTTETRNRVRKALRRRNVRV